MTKWTRRIILALCLCLLRGDYISSKHIQGELSNSSISKRPAREIAELMTLERLIKSLDTPQPTGNPLHDNAASDLRRCLMSYTLNGRYVNPQTYSVKSSNDVDPVQSSSAIFTCIGLTIYNPHNHRTLLAHINAFNDIDGTLKAFKEHYFPEREEDLQIGVFTPAAPRFMRDKLDEALGRYFARATVSRDHTKAVMVVGINSLDGLPLVYHDEEAYRRMLSDPQVRKELESMDK